MPAPTATQGSDTLGHVAAAGPLRIPTLAGARPGARRGAARRGRARGAARGLGPDGRALARQGLGDRPLGADGPGARAPVSDLSARLSRPRSIAAFDGAHRPRRAGQRRRLGDRDHRRARRAAPADRPADRLHLGRQRLPDCRPRGHRAGRRSSTPGADAAYELAVEGLGLGRVIARPFVGAPGALHPHRQPPRLRDAAAARHAARSAHRGRRAGDRDRQGGRTCSPAAASPTSRPTTSDADGLDQLEAALDDGRRGLVFVNLVDFDTPVRPPQRRRRLRRQPRALRPPARPDRRTARRRRPAGHHRRPRQRSGDAEHRSLARVRAGAASPATGCGPGSSWACATPSPTSVRRSRRGSASSPCRPAPACSMRWAEAGRLYHVPAAPRHDDSPRPRATRSRRPVAAGGPQRRHQADGSGPSPRIRSGRRSSAIATASSTPRRSAG